MGQANVRNLSCLVRKEVVEFAPARSTGFFT